MSCWNDNYSFPPTDPQQFYCDIYVLIFSSKWKAKLFIVKKNPDNQINYISNFFDRNCKLKSWLNSVQECIIKKNLYFKWYQLVHAIPKS